MKNTISLDVATYDLAAKMAKEEGIEIQEWLEQLIREHLARTRPIFFPVDTVQLLEELLEASGTNLSLDDYAREFLGNEITDSLVRHAGGVPEILDGSYQLEPGDMEAMKDVVARWNAKEPADSLKSNARGAA